MHWLNIIKSYLVKFLEILSLQKWRLIICTQVSGDFFPTQVHRFTDWLFILLVFTSFNAAELSWTGKLWQIVRRLIKPLLSYFLQSLLQSLPFLELRSSLLFGRCKMRLVEKSNDWVLLLLKAHNFNLVLTPRQHTCDTGRTANAWHVVFVGCSDLNDPLRHFSVDVNQLESLFVAWHFWTIFARWHVLDVLGYY